MRVLCSGLLVALLAPSGWAQAPLSSTVPVGNAAHHKIYSASTTINTLAGIVADVGANSITAAIYGVISYGAVTTVPATLTLDLSHGMINCNNVVGAVTIQGPYIIPEKQQVFLNCPNGSVVIANRSATIFPEMFGGSDWGVQLTTALTACPAGYACAIQMQNIAGGTAAASVNLTKSNVQIFFGPYTYTLAPNAQLTASGLTANIFGVELAGTDSVTTTLACNSPAGCVSLVGTYPLVGGLSQFVVQNNIAAGDRTFMALSGDIAGTGLTVGDVIKVGDWGFINSAATPDHQIVNDRVVTNIAGTTITVDRPFTFNFNTQGCTAWEKYGSGAHSTYIHDLKIQNNNGTTGRPLYVQLVYDFRLENTILYAVANPNTILAVFNSHNLILRNNTFITAQTNGGYIAEIAQIEGGLIYGNRFTCDATANAGSGLVLDFGANNIVVDSNIIDCIGAANFGIRIVEADNNILINNQISSNSLSGSGIDITGNHNILRDNTTTKFAYGILLQTAAYRTAGTLAGWQPSHFYAANACVAEVPENGWIFCTSAGGTSGANQPTWNETQSVRVGIPATGATTPDNTVSWIGMKYHTNTGTIIDGHKNFQIGTGGIQIQPNVSQQIIKNVTADANLGKTITYLNNTFGSGNIAGMITTLPDASGRQQFDGASIQQGFATMTGGLALATLPNPSGLAIAQVPGVCSICSTTFSYYVTALTANGGQETARTNITLASKDAVDANHKNRLTWLAVAGAACYNVYGRTSASELLLSACQLGTTFTDDGTLTPAGASAPTVNGTGRLTATAAGTLNTPTDAPVPCASGVRGLTYFDLSLNELCFCNATNWCKVSAPATCSSSTSCG
jgi:Right handed beta helix region